MAFANLDLKWNRKLGFSGEKDLNELFARHNLMDNSHLSGYESWSCSFICSFASHLFMVQVSLSPFPWLLFDVDFPIGSSTIINSLNTILRRDFNISMDPLIHALDLLRLAWRDPASHESRLGAEFSHQVNPLLTPFHACCIGRGNHYELFVVENGIWVLLRFHVHLVQQRNERGEIEFINHLLRVYSIDPISLVSYFSKIVGLYCPFYSSEFISLLY